MAVKYGAVKSFTTKESTIPAGAVDLGIVMTRTDGTTYKLYWAKSNLRDKGLCTKPEDYGDYYAWGETTTKSTYNWSTYTLCGGSESTLTKYCTSSSYGTVDSKTVLDPEDDVAHVKLGGKWRMPTYAEWKELSTKCTWTWVTNYNGSGINGSLVKATNGNSIFLPAAGYRYDTDLYNAGSYCGYRSSSLYTDNPVGAWGVDFDSDGVHLGGFYRYHGCSVRPVCDK